jgi:HSP20 family protein
VNCRPILDSTWKQLEDTTMAKKSNDKGKSGETAPSPVHPMTAWRDEMDRALGRFFSDDWMSGFPRIGRLWDLPGIPEGTRSSLKSMMTMPKADLSEDEKQFELTVELPGMDEKDLELTLAEGALVLKGEKKAESETKEKDFHVTERSYGSIRRRFALPPGVDVEKMDASFSKGVLKVVLPKSEEAASGGRKIEVRSD